MKTSTSASLLILLLCSIFLFQNCSSVSSVQPLPVDDSPMLREFPDFFQGEFKFVPSKNSSSSSNGSEIGDLYLKLALTDGHKLTVTRYFSFDDEQLKEYADYYQVQGDLLVFTNDSLSTLKKQLEDRKSTANNLSRSEEYKLERLEKQEEDGEIFKTYPLIKNNGRYNYNEQLLYTIDLKTNQMTMYTKNSMPDETKCVFKKYEDFYFVNTFNSKEKKWTCGILKVQNDDIIVSAIHFDNLQDNSDFYRSVANLIEVSKYDILIDPSASQFKSLMEDANFLEEFATLQRTSSSAVFKNYIWYIIGTVALIIVGFLITKRRKNTTA